MPPDRRIQRKLAQAITRPRTSAATLGTVYAVDTLRRTATVRIGASQTGRTYAVPTTSVLESLVAALAAGRRPTVEISSDTIIRSRDVEVVPDAARPVVARYSMSTTQAIAHNTATIVNFDQRQIDSHTRVQTGAAWRFVAPLRGYYLVSANVYFADATWPTATIVNMALYKNGAVVGFLDREDGTGMATQHMYLTGNPDAIELVAGDYIDVRVTQMSGVSQTIRSAQPSNHIAIWKL